MATLFAANKLDNTDYFSQVDLYADLSPVSTVASTPSVGSSCSIKCDDAAELEVFETYPGLFVKNTFYEFMPLPLCGPVSSLRRVQSAPSWRASPTPLAAHRHDTGLTFEADTLSSYHATGQAQHSPRARRTANAIAIPSFIPFQRFTSEEQDTPAEQRVDTPTLPVLRLAEALALPKVGDPEIPTLGSEQHDTGRCKPCAFVWKEVGCSSGVNCLYCHICGPSERRRRKKQQRDSHHLGTSRTSMRGSTLTARSGI